MLQLIRFGGFHRRAGESSSGEREQGALQIGQPDAAPGIRLFPLLYGNGGDTGIYFRLRRLDDEPPY